jgi:glutathione S-transferase
MKLFYSPGACSVGIHILLEEIGKPFTLELVSLKDQAQHAPGFKALNPKGKIPLLERDDGSLLTQYTAMAYWLAAANPEAGLWPAGLEAQTRALEFVDYITGTVHPQGFTRQFRAGYFTPSEADQPKVVEQGKALATGYFEVIDRQWQGDTWVMPEGYGIADSALFFVEFWAIKRVGLPVAPRITAHYQAMLARPAVQRALAASGVTA